MGNNKAAGTKNYTGILQQINLILNLPLPEIRNKYADTPAIVIEDSEEKFIRIKFDSEEITINCMYNDIGKCNFIYLFPENKETATQFINYLKETHEYDYLHSRWITTGYYIKINKLNLSPDDVCFMLLRR